MSRNDELWERGLRILDCELPMSEEEAVAVLQRHLGINKEEAKEIYGYWVVT